MCSIPNYILCVLAGTSIKCLGRNITNIVTIELYYNRMPNRMFVYFTCDYRVFSFSFLTSFDLLSAFSRIHAMDLDSILHSCNVELLSLKWENYRMTRGVNTEHFSCRESTYGKCFLRYFRRNVLLEHLGIAYFPSSISRTWRRPYSPWYSFRRRYLTVPSKLHIVAVERRSRALDVCKVA